MSNNEATGNPNKPTGLRSGTVRTEPPPPKRREKPPRGRQNTVSPDILSGYSGTPPTYCSVASRLTEDNYPSLSTTFTGNQLTRSPPSTSRNTRTEEHPVNNEDYQAPSDTDNQPESYPRTSSPSPGREQLDLSVVFERSSAEQQEEQDEDSQQDKEREEESNEEESQVNSDSHTSHNMDADAIKQFIEDALAARLTVITEQHEQEKKNLHDTITALTTANKELMDQVKTSPTTALTKALKNITLRPTDSSLEKPRFRLGSCTSAYLKEVEGYLRSQGIQEPNFLASVKPILPDELKDWYEYLLPSALDWRSFKDSFEKKFGGFGNLHKMRTEIQNRKQRANEPTERFIYEYFNQSKQCYPDDDTKTHVLRIQTALWPKLRTALGPRNLSSIVDLVNMCENVTSSLEGEDRVAKRFPYSIPPMRSGERKDGAHSNPGTNGNSSRGGRERSNRGRGFSNGQMRQKFGSQERSESESYLENGFQRSRGFQQNRGFQGNRNFHGSRGSQGSRGFQGNRGFQTERGSVWAAGRRRASRWRGGSSNRGYQQNGGYQEQSARSNQPSTSSGSTAYATYKQNRKFGNNPPSSLEKCRKCQGYGHRSTECPSKVSYQWLW